MIATATEQEPHDSLAEIRDSARKERLIDMELRLRRYRAGCFAILALGLIPLAPELGWWWIAPMALGFAGFAVADRFMRASGHPAIWVGAAWGLTPLLLAGAVLSTGGAASPALMWFALPAVTLGARFEPRGIAIGTVYILALLLLSTIVLGPPGSAADNQAVFAAVALVLSTVTLSGALVESDRTHRRRSTVDPLTGLFNRNALELRLAELDGQRRQRPDGLAMRCCSATSITSSASTTGSATPPATRSCRRSPTRCAPTSAPATRSTGSAARRSSSSCRGRPRRTRSTSPSACGSPSASCARSG